MDEFIARVAQLEAQLHLSWQHIEEEGRVVRHLSLELQRLLVDMRTELADQLELLPEVTSQWVVGADPSGEEEYTQSVFTRSWDQVAGKWVYRQLPV